MNTDRLVKIDGNVKSLPAVIAAKTGIRKFLVFRTFYEPIKNRSGYTFIELMIAIAIFSIGFLAVAGMQVRALNTTTRARVVTQALEMATSQAEHFHALSFYPSFQQMDASSGERFTDHPQLAAGTSEIQVGNYTVISTITDDTPLPPVENVYTPVKDPPFITISKTIVVAVHETRQPGTILAELEMIKVWTRDL